MYQIHHREKARYNSTSHFSANTRIIISRINVHLEHIVECFSFFLAKFYVEEMRFFVEESECAKREADDDGENDGALICCCFVLFFNHRKICFSIARGKRCDAK